MLPIEIKRFIYIETFPEAPRGPSSNSRVLASKQI